MVNIIINDEKDNEELSNLMKDLFVKMDVLEQTVKTMDKNNIEKFNSLFESLEKKLSDGNIKESNPKKITVTGKKRGRKLKDSDIYVPNISVSKDWVNLTLQKDGRLVSKGHKKFVLPIDLNDLFYIMEQDSPYMTRGISKDLQEKYNVHIGTWGKLIYNIRANNFDNIIVDYYNRVNKVKFELDNEDNLLIDGNKTGVPKKLVYDWIQLLINSNHKERTILSIQESYPEFDKYNIRIICDNYNNNVLSKIIGKPEVKEFIENNPSKRRNMIKNGGLI